MIMPDGTFKEGFFNNNIFYKKNYQNMFSSLNLNISPVKSLTLNVATELSVVKLVFHNLFEPKGVINQFSTLLRS